MALALTSCAATARPNMTHTMMLAILITAAVPMTPAAKPPEIIAHRGESSLAPENTLAAVELAWKQGADAVEIDCHSTADGHLVVCHDSNTERTTGKKLVIGQSTLAELRALDAGTWKGATWAGQKIPLLKEVLDTVPENRRLFVEVKVGPEVVPALKRTVEAARKRTEQVVVISFQPSVIAEVKRQMPQYRAFLLVDFQQDNEKRMTGASRQPFFAVSTQSVQGQSPFFQKMIAAARAVKADGVDVAAQPPLDRPFVEALRQARLEVYAWTVDSPEVARRLIDFGIAGITTNRAGWMREQLSTRSAGRSD
jgi:glycerophosphoryl diester phosphodiesterase